jgi:hypothetical protein
VSDWQDRQTQAREDQLTVFGEEVGLPSGGTVLGVYYPLGDPAPDFGPVQGVVGRPSAQPNPYVLVAESDAAGLKVGSAPVVLRGLPYRVTQIDPDGAGMVRVELRRQASGADPLAGMP